MSYTLVDDEPRATFTLVDDAPQQPGLREQGAKMPTAGRAFINAAQGPLFGFADEIGGAVAAGVDKFTGRNPGMGFGDLYTRYRDVARGGSEQYQKDNPIVAPLGQVAASLPFMGIAGMAERALPQAAGRLGVVRNAAVVGAGMGGLGGAGSAESIADIPGEVGFGALTGGVLSGTMSGFGQAAGALGNNMVARGANSRVVQDRVRDGGVGGGAARFVTRRADDLARERIAAAMARDNRTAGQVGTRLTRLGDDAPLAVGAGKNTLDLLDTTATMPGRTAELVERTIRTQQAGRGGRIELAAERSLATGGQRLVDALDDLIAQRSNQSAPLYARVRAMTVEADDEIARLVASANTLGAGRVAQRIAEARGTPFTLGDVSAARPGPLGVGQQPGTAMSMRDLDYLKEGLDDLVSKATRPDGSVTREGMAVLDLKNRLLARLDEATGGVYRQAREAFAGPSALMDAANAGRRAMTQDGVSLQAMTRAMSESELAAFRVGAFESLRTKVGTEGGQTQILKMWKEPATQEKLRALFPDIRSYREFAAEVAKEARKKSIEGVGRGSQTASRQARMDDEGAAFLQSALDLGNAARGSPAGILSAARNLYGRTVMPEPVRDQIGGMLLQRGPQAQGLLGDLSRFVDAENARRSAQAARIGLLGGVGINALFGN